MKKDIKEEIFNLTQKFLKNPPLVVWGSGATISFGLPSMWDLNEDLKKNVPGFDNESDNLEDELGKEKYQEKMPTIRKIIWNKINESDISVLDKISNNDLVEFQGIKNLIYKFSEAHPQVLNIVTTNYDRVLEYIMAYENILFTDGYNGRALSLFNENLFKNKNIVNLIKVHGSLNWFEINGEFRYSQQNLKRNKPLIIAPGKTKFQEAFDSPYRELIQKADNCIKDAASFLVIGFGFNDKHLTPRVKTQIKKGVPIVLITKKISPNTFKEIKYAQKYILFEELTEEKTKVIYKSSKESEVKEVIINGNYWQLNKFMEIL
ncbi:SIR2 family protein [Polaribacter sp. 20A6]|uniref:SIR2 family protein n=1 Tax=Polaribacter sp. 20A6 TaxID=2687289 RepID=UPI0013FD9CDC|nr:SIR2 family protein [Polaribacter sp. 20A6]